MALSSGDPEIRCSQAAHGGVTALEIARETSYKRRMEFRILGPLEVVAEDGEPLVLGGQKQRAVLAVLLLQANHVVSMEFLVDALWGEQPPKTATTSLHNAISALRKIVGVDRLVTQPPGYKLVVPAEAIDLGRFELLVAGARELQPPERARQLRDALGLWRGEPLAEVAGEPFAVAELRRLEELRLRVVEDRIDADLACDRHGDLVPELESLVSQWPYRERLRGQLMLALYRSGRQADALRVYQETRKLLVDELGLEPGAELKELHAQILRQQVPRPRRARVDVGDSHLEEVAAALLAGRLIPVLGADGEPLASELAQRFGYPDDVVELTRVAQYVALTKGEGPLYDELHALLELGAAPAPVHRFFASLPPLLRERGIPHQLLVTTGYDLALEQALLAADEEFDVVSYVATGRHRGRFFHRSPDGATRVIDLPNTYATELSLERRTIVLKLHGGVDASAAREQESFVVTEDDYIAYLARNDVGSAVPVGLAARLRRSHFLFLGYGMREWGLRLVLDRISNGEPLAYRSWAVVPEARPLERQFWQSRGVDLLEQSLDDYVDALASYVGLGVVEAA
jgi:DNA-binding SARP family transcriptional activator